MQKSSTEHRVILAVAAFLVIGVAPPNGLFAADERVSTAAPTPAEIEFFEKRVRPVLVENCFKCHGPEKQKGGLRLDSRAGVLKGGDTGPAVNPGKSGESELIDAVNYGGDSYQMPPTGKLPKRHIDALTTWVKMGAPWPAAHAGETGVTPQKTFDLEERKRFWSFQPVKRPAIPEVNRNDWPAGEIDRFILSRLEREGLAPADDADRRTLTRRAYFDVIGLPPTPEEVDAFMNDDAPDAWAKVVDRLLDSPHYGERWGRHWLDLVRYAESRGHEFDYDAPNVHHYRDYVIRALNADVPYDRFVTEHVAGDLLPEPRLHPETEANESILGTGFWHLGEWVHSPVDVRQDEADRFDNSVDVFSKTFLGLTVACARCHDHKFDAVSQRDYYALFGYLQSSNYRLTRFETTHHNRRIAEDLQALRDQARPVLQKALAERLRPGVAQTAEYLQAAREAIDAGPQFKSDADGVVFEDFESGDYSGWKVEGDAFGTHPQTLETIADYQGKINAVGRFFVNSHNVSGAEAAGRHGDQFTGKLTSREFTIRHAWITLLVGGGAHKDATCVNLNVDGKIVLSATGRNDNQMSPVRWDVRKWRGRKARIEIIDQHTGGWGNIGVDQIAFTNNNGGRPAYSAASFTETYAGSIRVIAAQHGVNPARLVDWVAHLLNAKDDPSDPLAAFIGESSGNAATTNPAKDAQNSREAENVEIVLDYVNDPDASFQQDGVSFGARAQQPGDVRLTDDSANPIAAFVTRGAAERDPGWNRLQVASGSMNDLGKINNWERAGRMLRTPTFEITTGRIFSLIRGGANVWAGVDSHRLVNGPLHGALLKEFPTPADDGAGPEKASHRFRWVEHDLTRYKGHRAHLEFTTRGDEPFALAVVVQAERQPANPFEASNGLLRKAFDAVVDANAKTRSEACENLLLATIEQLSEDEVRGASDAADRAELANWLLEHDRLFATGTGERGGINPGRHPQVIPQGSDTSRRDRSIVARRFIAGYVNQEYASPERTTESPELQSHQRLVQSSLRDYPPYFERKPGSELPGYSRKSLRDDGRSGLVGDDQGISPPVNALTLDSAAKVSSADNTLSQPRQFRNVRDVATPFIQKRSELLNAVRPVSHIAPAMMDGSGDDEYLFIRGSHAKRGDVVPRRFLEALAGDDQPPPERGSGRLDLARRVVDPSNPLTARVMVNRLWLHYFGRGIVATPDDFGRMGARPTHPELLDWLAAEFTSPTKPHAGGIQTNGGAWSLKRMHRLILLSRAYAMSSRADNPRAERADPHNLWLHRMNVKRLEGEAVRDAILAVSGRLDPAMFGPSVPVHLTPFMEGRGRPKQSGPVDGNGRRSIYISVRRNFLDPMFLAFDFPTPHSTIGRRSVSNVPAQALTMMNNPLVIQQARVWAERVLRERPDSSVEDRIQRLYVAAFSRPPTPEELKKAVAFLEAQEAAYGDADETRAWADLCHVLFNVKEFMYVN